MKKIVVAFIVLFVLSSCYSTPEKVSPVVEYQYSFDGCKVYSNNRRQYQSCLNNMFKIWQERENADSKLEKIDSKRYNDKWIETTYTLCRADECQTFVLPEYKPTIMYHIRNDGGFTVLGAILFWVATL